MSMKSALNSVGIFWACLSFCAVALSSVGFYMPLWLEGSLHNTTASSLNTFRRCHFHRIGSDGHLQLVSECGRYASFDDIPCFHWQIATILTGIGCGLLLFVSFGAMFSCCVQYLVSITLTRIGGTIQFIGGLCIAAGCVLFPVGWGNKEVKAICGSEADIFKIGHCQLGWAFYVTIAGAACAFICSLLSCNATQPRGGYQRSSLRT